MMKAQKLPCMSCDTICESALRLFSVGKIVNDWATALGIKCPKDGKTYQATRKLEV